MGNFCYSKQKKPRSEVSLKRPVPQDELFCKPKTSSSSLICYKAKNKTLWEEPLDCNILFQTGSIFGKVSENVYISVGGLESGDVAFKLFLDTKSTKPLRSPPIPLSYGFMHQYRGVCYIIGSITQSQSGHEMPADYLQYNLKTDDWSYMPRPPI